MPKPLPKPNCPVFFAIKKAKWETGVKAMNETVAAFKLAVAKKETQGMLDAAENLHRNYEKLIRIVTPVVKEIEAFHETLYPLYHYYVAQYDYEKVSASVKELKVKMDSLNTVVLPERMKKRIDNFIAARTALSNAVDELVKTVATKDEAKIKAAVEAMHTGYVNLEKVFD